VKLEEAVIRACSEPTLVDALSWIAVWDSERAVRQAIEHSRTGVSTAHHGGGWDTCFKHCFELVFERWQHVVPNAWVEVASAVIIRDGRILLTQRRPDKDFPLTWECPGGKIESGESVRDALQRELTEEIGVTLEEITDRIWKGEFRNMVQRGERAHVCVSFWPVTLTVASRPAPLEGQGLGWFSAAELRHLRLAPANSAALDELLRHLPAEPSP